MAGSGDTGSDQLASLVPDATFVFPASAAPQMNLPVSPDLLPAVGWVEAAAAQLRRSPENPDAGQQQLTGRKMAVSHVRVWR
jgi:hypothetical protein